jgi:hypothetical protein
MSQVVSLRPEPLPGAPLAGLFASAQKAAQDGFRLLFLTLGWVLICGGVVLAILPFLHTLGVLLLAIGLIVVLRNSYRAKRQFIQMHRRHPRFVHPVRRLIRREPEIFPVLWQQMLRLERTVLPSRWRRAGAWRRRYFKRRTSA